MLKTNIKRALLALPVLGLGVVVLSQRELPANPVEPAEYRLEPSAVLQSVVLNETDALAAPTDVEVLGERLVIADDFADHPLSVLSRADGSILRSFGRKGRGPREFESAFSIDVIDPSGEFMVHDLMLQRVTHVDLEEDFEAGEWVADRSVKLDAPAMLTETAWSPNGLKGLGTFREGRLAHLTSQGKLVRTTGRTPLEGQEVPPNVRQLAYQSKLKANPSRTRWAVATRYSDRLDIYDTDGALVAQGTRPYGFEPVYEVKQSGSQFAMASDDDLRFGYLDLATTDERIYALFSGRTRGQGRANYGQMLHVFDWSGRLLAVLQLDSPVIALAVDPNGDALYGIRHDPFPAILAFDMETRAGE